MDNETFLVSNYVANYVILEVNKTKNLNFYQKTYLKKWL